MYCSDWEKGANQIVAHQHKWLLQRNYHICKILAHRPFHASLIGVVTDVGEQHTFSAFHSITVIHFWPPTSRNMAVAKQMYTEVPKMWRLMQWVYGGRSQVSTPIPKIILTARNQEMTYQIATPKWVRYIPTPLQITLPTSLTMVTDMVLYRATHQTGLIIGVIPCSWAAFIMQPGLLHIVTSTHP